VNIEKWIDEHEEEHDWVIYTSHFRELLVDYALVPRVPTVAMMKAGYDAMEDGGPCTAFLAMIKAAGNDNNEAHDNPADVIVGEGKK